MVRALIAGKATLDPYDGREWSPLMYAAKRGHRDVINQLIRAQADVDASKGQRFYTPLLLAAHYGHPASVELLMRAGANPKGYTLPLEQFEPQWSRRWSYRLDRRSQRKRERDRRESKSVIEDVSDADIAQSPDPD